MDYNYEDYDDQENDENVLQYDEDVDMDSNYASASKERAGNPQAYFHVINSFQVPKYTYNAVEGRFSKYVFFLLLHHDKCCALITNFRVQNQNQNQNQQSDGPTIAICTSGCQNRHVSRPIRSY
jgi:hypothetical protein